MRKVLISLIIAGLFIQAYLLVRILLGSYIDNSVLTIASYILAVFLTPILYLTFDDMLIIVALFFGTVIAPFLILITDNTFSEPVSETMYFKIERLNTNVIRMHNMYTVTACNQIGCATYPINEKESWQPLVGQFVPFDVTIGFYGYPQLKNPQLTKSH